MPNRMTCVLTTNTRKPIGVSPTSIHTEYNIDPNLIKFRFKCTDVLCEKTDYRNYCTQTPASSAKFCEICVNPQCKVAPLSRK